MNSYYLGVDLNLPDNIKIIRLKQRLGYSGFGLYLELCLRLAQASDYKLPTDYQLLAYQTRLDEKYIKQVIEEFDLFTVEGGEFWSDEIVQKMHTLESKREAARKAGIASGKARSTGKRTNVEQPFERTLNNKGNKGKEINKENNFENFWNFYQKKGNKKKSKEIFFKLTENQITKILEVVPKYVEATPEPQFRKNAETWLRNECWDDEITPLHRQSKRQDGISLERTQANMQSKFKNPDIVL